MKENKKLIKTDSKNIKPHEGKKVVEVEEEVRQSSVVLKNVKKGSVSGKSKRNDSKESN